MKHANNALLSYTYCHVSKNILPQRKHTQPQKEPRIGQNDRYFTEDLFSFNENVIQCHRNVFQMVYLIC